MQFRLSRALAIALTATSVSAKLELTDIVNALTSLSAGATQLAEQTTHENFADIAMQLIDQYTSVLHSPLIHFQSATKRDLFPFLGIGHDVTATDLNHPVIQAAQSGNSNFVNSLSEAVHDIPDLTEIGNSGASASEADVNTPSSASAKSMPSIFSNLIADVGKTISNTISGTMLTHRTKRVTSPLPVDLCAELNNFVTSHQNLITKITAGSVAKDVDLSDAVGALMADFSKEVTSFEQLLALVNPTCAAAAKSQLDALRQSAANASKALSH